ncbi:MAG: RNA 2'-phosphotransferase [Deltaproteobacteria bacterium]|nr:RNA 2'-phosphotransferase [Deltaproteobacteria bacterium]
MKKQKSLKPLAKFIDYMLGRKPDEFGLVPNTDGFVKLKEFLKAVREEDGWRHVRQANIDEILITLPNPPFEIKENLIRARCRDHLSEHILARDLPKHLYTCVREKSYPFVLDKGIFPTGHSHVILSSSLEMAQRISQRIDQTPIPLTISVRKSLEQNVAFYQAGDLLYLAQLIPADCFTGPFMPKPKPETKKQSTPEKKIKDSTPGSFILDLHSEKNQSKHAVRQKGEKASSWKKDKKRMRKQKQKMWPM